MIDLGIFGDDNGQAVPARQVLPDLLCHKRNDGMEEFQDRFQYVPQNPSGDGCGIGIEQGLRELDIPVAEQVPGELIELVRSVVEPILLQSVSGRLNGLIELGQDPCVGQAELPGIGGRPSGSEALNVGQDELPRIPDLVDEEAVPLDALVADPDIPSHGGEGGKCKPEGVGTVFVHLDDGVHDVAFGLAHLLPLLVPDKGMEVHVVERHVAHELDAHHHHPSDPEKENVETGDEYVGGIEFFEGPGLFRPAHGGKRPQPGGKPCVEHVGLLPERVRLAVRAGRGIFLADNDLPAMVAVPGGDAVAPPYLTGDAPVADVIHPFIVGFLPLFGDDSGPALFHRLDGLFRQGLGVHEPLLRQVRLDDGLAPIALSHRDRIRGLVHEIPLLLKIVFQLSPALEAVQSLIRTRVLVHDP